MTLISPFLSRKMKQRMVSISSKQDPQETVEGIVGGKQWIPRSIGPLDGTMEKDLVIESLRSMEG